MKLSTLALSVLAVVSVGSFAAQQPQMSQGEYLARAGDCVACHTKEGGEPFTGGRAVDSPFGAIYSTNITPDKKTGIGNYTLEQFDKALREGIRADGAFLYPAMPYPDYAKLSDEDVKLLYAYFTKELAAVENEVPETQLMFPFSQRWGIRMWNWVATDATPFTPDPKQSQAYNRGAYLIQGPGHCGSCHTPRGVVFQEKGYDEDKRHFLSGGMVGMWYAPGLRGGEGGEIADWTKQDIVDYLATGRNNYTSTAGEMTDVILHSTSYLSDEDLDAMATYLKALPGEGLSAALVAVGQYSELTTDILNKATMKPESGARLYLDNCGACHFTDGQGAPKVFPRLNRSSMVNAKDPSGLIHVILAGATVPSTAKAPEELVMPGFGWRLSDEEVATLASFVRKAWGNHAGAVTPKAVAKVRATIPEAVLEKSAPKIPD